MSERDQLTLLVAALLTGKSYGTLGADAIRDTVAVALAVTKAINGATA